MNNHFHSRFNATSYLNTRFNHPGNIVLRDFIIGKVHEFFKATKFDTVKPGESLTVLDYGCGPALAHVIISATEITLAEFTPECRKEVQLWLDKDPSAWDWTPYIKYVVQTLERNEDEHEIIRREESLRNLIKAVVPCDISQTPPIAEGFAGPCYDVVMSVLCLEGACETKGDYKAAIKRLTGLIKPGGYLCKVYCLIMPMVWCAFLVVHVSKLIIATACSVVITFKLIVQVLLSQCCNTVYIMVNYNVAVVI